MRASLPIMRLFIIAAAVMIWANVTAFTVKTKTISLPIQIEGVDSGMAVAEAIPEVQVNISGRAVDLVRVNEENLIFAANLSGLTLGQSQEVTVELKQTPRNIKVLSYTPHSLSLSVDQAITKTLPVTVEPNGYVADGFTISQITTTPSEVSITGSPKLLDQLTEVLARVDVSRRRATFTVPAVPEVQMGYKLHPTNLLVSPTSIGTTITIVQGAATRNLGVKPIFAGTTPAGFFLKEVIFDPPLVTITGNQRIIDALPNLVTTPIQLNDHSLAFTDQVSVILPTGVQVVGNNLLNARVVIERSEASREFNLSPEFINVTEGFGVASFTPRSIKLVVVGEQGVLAALSRSDIKLLVDLQRALTGSNQISITAGMFSLPAGVGVGSFTPDSIEVILSRL